MKLLVARSSRGVEGMGTEWDPHGGFDVVRGARRRWWWRRRERYRRRANRAGKEKGEERVGCSVQCTGTESRGAITSRQLCIYAIL